MVDEKLVDHLARLSRLKFTPEEKIAMQNDMGQMIAFVEKLNELDTTGVEPLRHMTPHINAWRNDEVSGSVSRASAFQNATNHNAEFFKVPKVIHREP